MRFIKGCLGVMAGLVLLVILFFVVLVVNYRTGWFDQETTRPVQSPDGTYSAYIGMRGMMDNARCRLYIKKGGERARRVLDLYRGDLKWSPDSRKVAVVSMPYGDSATIWIYDVKTNRSCRAEVNPAFTEIAADQWMVKWDWAEFDLIDFRAVNRGNLGAVNEQSVPLLRCQVVEKGSGLVIVPHKGIEDPPGTRRGGANK